MALGRTQHTGAAPTTGLSVGISSGATSFTVQTGGGTGYPDGSVGNFLVGIDMGTATAEKVGCASRSGDTFTVATSGPFTSAGTGRGADNTSASAHSSGTTNVQHVLGAAEIDDANAHVSTPSRDDHTNYAKADGTRAFTGAVTISSGGLTITAGGQTITAGGEVITAGALALTTGITGAATASRYVGGTAGGAPGSGTFVTGDYCVDTVNGTILVCTSGGTPGTWVGLTDAAWTNVFGGVGFQNGWGDAGGGFMTVGFRKVNGIVNLRGQIIGGSYGTAAGNVAFTLPAGYRPSATAQFATVSNGGASLGTIQIGSDGKVYPAVGASGHSISLGVVQFDTL